MEKLILDCGHVESEHSEITRGYGVDENGKKHCYDCCLKADIKALKETGKVTAYISSDKKQITTWTGYPIAKITAICKTDFGYCRDQTSFHAILEDGTLVYGRGPGEGMYCRVKTFKN